MSSRVLAAWYQTGKADLSAHLSVHGPLRLPDRREHGYADRLIEAIRLSGLTGRGGATFPTARKWDVLSQARRPVVVVNAMEGEPESDKNSALLCVAPHLVLDGVEVAAFAIGAEAAIVCVADDQGASLRALVKALDERAGAGIGHVRLQVRRPPSGYVTGEESALVNWLGTGLPQPTFRPDKAVPLTLGRRPVLVHNVETLAHVALIARYGPNWFRGVGLPDAPGTALVTASGALEHRGVYEVELGTPIGSILERGQPTSALGALLVGGYGGTWLAPELLDTPYAPQPLALVGGAIGPGILVALPVGICGVAETARIARTWRVRARASVDPVSTGFRP